MLAPLGEEQHAIDVVLGAFAPRRPDAGAFAIARRVLLVYATNRVAVDLALAASPFEIEVLDRSSAWAFDAGRSIVT